MKKNVLIALSAGLVFGSGIAHAQMKPEDAIKFRQSGYSFMAWNMGKIKGQVDGPADKFDKDLVNNAALAIKGVANSGMGALFLPGTDMKSTTIKTRALPEIFDPAKKEELGKAAKNFVMQANKLAEVAAGGDAAAVKTQFGELGKACKGCHDTFRYEEKK